MDDTYGGFSQLNIMRSLAKDCLESGDPVSYFYALVDAVDQMAYESEAADIISYLESILQ